MEIWKEKYIIIKSGGVHVTKAVLWGTFIVKNIYLEKKESWKIKHMCSLKEKKLEKNSKSKPQSWKKEIKSRNQWNIKQIYNRKIIKFESWFFGNIIKMNKPLAILMKKTNIHTHKTNTRNENGHIL